MSEWMWFVVHKSDNGQWVVSDPTNNNTSAYERAKALAKTYPGMEMFVVETTHRAYDIPVSFRPINKVQP